ncbi:MAG: WD40/YVTN/BNR-like repeat-containing protein [Rhodothermaceae bacterium]
MSIVDDNVIWVSGSKGTILKSVNGGDTWQNVSPKNFAEKGFRDIHAWDKEKAIIMGIASPAIFLKTEDGGKNWKEVYQNSLENIFFDSMEFWNDSCGMAFSDPINKRHFIIKTTDYGNSWQEIDTINIPFAVKGEAAFAASGTCISTSGDNNAWFVTGGTEARVFKSTDQGIKWKAVTSPLISGLSTTGIYSVCFKDEKNGFITGGDYTKDKELNANAAVTTDGGLTWTLLKNKPQGFKSCVSYIPHIKDGVIVTGTSGTDISFDNGKNWSQIDTTSFNTIGFSQNGNGWAVGDKGLIYKVILRKKK